MVAQVLNGGINMSEKILPPWASQIPEGAFISYEQTYKVGEYFDRFHKENFSGMDYYFYDPTEHGFAKDKKYPVLIFMHGFSNALVGDVCINYAGAEFYSKDEYQKSLGGAYILVPLANEHKDKEGNCVGSWDDSYLPKIHDLICNFEKTFADGRISKRVVFGNSSGATMCFKLASAYPDFFNILVPIGGNKIPDDQTLDIYEKNGIRIFYAIGMHDEFVSFEEVIKPRLERISKIKGSRVFTPEWVYNGDGGIASINFGMEMGQHCLVNPMHCNLMFDNGKPMDATLPQGITGWLHDALN